MRSAGGAASGRATANGSGGMGPVKRAAPPLTLALLAACALLLSCDLVGLMQPPFAGTWTGEDATATPIGGTLPTLELTLGRDEYLWLDRVPDASGRPADSSGLKGALSARGGVITLSIDLVGQPPFDANGLPQGALAWAEPGSSSYEAVAALLPSTTLQARYAIAGAVMTLIPDLNGDGSFDEYDPTLSLTKS